jgi:hypothetical protein
VWLSCSAASRFSANLVRRSQLRSRLPPIPRIRLPFSNVVYMSPTDVHLESGSVAIVDHPSKTPISIHIVSIHIAVIAGLLLQVGCLVMFVYRYGPLGLVVLLPCGGIITVCSYRRLRKRKTQKNSGIARVRYQAGVNPANVRLDSGWRVGRWMPPTKPADTRPSSSNERRLRTSPAGEWRDERWALAEREAFSLFDFNFTESTRTPIDGKTTKDNESPLRLPSPPPPAYRRSEEDRGRI